MLSGEGRGKRLIQCVSLITSDFDNDILDGVAW